METRPPGEERFEVVLRAITEIADALEALAIALPYHDRRKPEAIVVELRGMVRRERQRLRESRK